MITVHVNYSKRRLDILKHVGPCRADKLDAVNTPNERISTWWDNFVSETDLEKA